MLTQILLPALLLISFGVNAQQTEYYLTVKAANTEEEKVFSKLDSALFAYVKSIKGKKTLNEKALNLQFNEGHHWWMQLQGDEIRLDTKELTALHLVKGYWTNTYDKLRIQQFANIYLHDTTASVRYDTTMKLDGKAKIIHVFNGNNYLKNAIDFAGYQKLVDSVTFKKTCAIIQNQMSADLNLIKVNDTLLLSEYIINRDTVILPQVNINDAAYEIEQSVVNGHIDSYTDWTFSQPYDRYNAHYNFTHADTTSFADAEDPNIIHDTVVVSYAGIQQIKTMYRWQYSFSKYSVADWGTPRYLTLTRVPYAIGIYLETGKVFYVRYVDAMYTLKDHGYPAEGFNQCMETVFYNTLKLDLDVRYRVVKK